MGGPLRPAAGLTAGAPTGCASSERCAAARACLAEPGSTARFEAVRRAVQRMRQHLADPHCLTDHAHAGLLSPYHFHRVFRAVTATTPARFLAALRMAEAQRLLVRSPMRATDVALAVGYSSLSSFTAQFTRLVGFNPRRFRTLVRLTGHLPVEVAVRQLAGAAPSRQPGLTAMVSDVAGQALFTGLFPHGIPQGLPVSGSVGAGQDGTVHLALPAPGSFELLSVAFDPHRSIADTLADVAGRYRRVAALPEPLRLPEQAPGPYRLRLRPPQVTDPPVVVALPLFGAVPDERYRAGHRGGAGGWTTARQGIRS